MGVAAFASFVLLSGGNRRRMNTYEQEEGTDGVECTIKSEEEVDAVCENLVGDNYVEDYCFDCIACESEPCVAGITAAGVYDCEEFLGEAYSMCTEEEEGVSLLVLIGALVILLCFCCVCICFCFVCIRERLNSGGIRTRKEKNREAMSAFNGPGLGPLVFSGTYRENGDEKPTSYNLNITPGGTFSGSSTDDDGTAMVDGKVYILSGADRGDIAWCETRPSFSIEASGSIHVSPVQVIVKADYISSYGKTKGSVEVSAANPCPGLQQGQIIYGGAGVAPIVVGQAVDVPGNAPTSAGNCLGDDETIKRL